jgi:signal transduction histidine kinase
MVMKNERKLLANGTRWAPEDLDAQLLAAFSKTSAIELAVLDNQLRYRLVNNAVAAATAIPVEAFVGSTIRDIVGDAALEIEARFRRVLAAGEIPWVEFPLMQPKRNEVGYWIHKIFPIKGQSGRITQLGSLAVEVTAHRKLEEIFRKLGGNQLRRNEEYQRLARELHEVIGGYHAALGMNLDRLSHCASRPERIPELLTQSTEFLDERMRKLACVIARCFSVDQPQLAAKHTLV